MFNLADHLSPDLMSASFCPKKNYSGLINLASNEFQSDELDKLLSDYLSYYSLTTLSLNRYVCYDIYRKMVAENLKLPIDMIGFSPGSDSAISLLLSLFSQKHNHLILQYPNYYNYKHYASIFGFNIKCINYLHIDNQSYIKNLIKVLACSHPSILVLTNPDSYIGKYYGASMIKKILTIANEHNHLVMIDEAYNAFAPDNHWKFLQQFKNLIIIHTLSKGYGSAGVRLALLLAHPELIVNIKKLGIENGVSCYALNYLEFICNNFVRYQQIIKEYINRRNHFITLFSQRLLKWTIYHSQANFIALDIHNSVQASEITGQLQKKKRIVIRHLKVLSSQLESFIRITVGSEQHMQTVMGELELMMLSC